jgi:hypothetical protein
MKTRRHLPAIVYIASAVIAWLVLALAFHPSQGTPPVAKPAISKFGEKGLEITLEMNKLVITATLLVFAAVGKIALADGESRRPLNLFSRLLLSVAVLFAALALYFSYVIYDKLVEMLAAGFLDLNSDLILGPRDLQLYSLLLSVLVLGLLVIHRSGAEVSTHACSEEK